MVEVFHTPPLLLLHPLARAEVSTPRKNISQNLIIDHVKASPWFGYLA